MSIDNINSSLFEYNANFKKNLQNVLCSIKIDDN